MANCSTELTTDVNATNIDVVSQESTISIDPQLTNIDVNSTELVVTPITENTEISLVSQEVSITLNALQGPAGIAESEMVYAQRIDFINDNLIYRAEAAVGSLSSQSLWRIRRLTIDLQSDDDVTTEWADGVSAFTKIWDDRLTYTYT